MKKLMRLVFKSGVSVTTPYSYKLYTEIAEKMGKPGEGGGANIVEGKNFITDVSNVEGLFFEVEEDDEAQAAAPAEKAEAAGAPAKESKKK